MTIRAAITATASTIAARPGRRLVPPRRATVKPMNPNASATSARIADRNASSCPPCDLMPTAAAPAATSAPSRPAAMPRPPERGEPAGGSAAIASPRRTSS